MFKNVILVAAMAVSSLVLVSCGDARVEMVKNYHSNRQKDSSVKVNLPQEVVVNGESLAVTVGDSIKQIQADFKRFWNGRKGKTPTEAINLTEDLLSFTYSHRDEARDLMLKGIRKGDWKLEYDGKRLMDNASDDIKLYKEWIDILKGYEESLAKYNTIETGAVLAYTFEATIITSIPLKDTSIEVTNTYVTDASGTKVINAFSKGSNLTSLLN